jgi:hypothetical protein
MTGGVLRIHAELGDITAPSAESSHCRSTVSIYNELSRRSVFSPVTETA